MELKGKSFFSPSHLFVENPSRDLRPRTHSRGAEKKYTSSASTVPRRQDCQRRKSDGRAAGEAAELLPFPFQCVGHKKKMRRSCFLGCPWSSLWCKQWDGSMNWRHFASQSGQYKEICCVGRKHWIWFFIVEPRRDSELDLEVNFLSPFPLVQRPCRSWRGRYARPAVGMSCSTT